MALGEASGQAIRETIPKLSGYWQNRYWLPHNNAYRKDPARKLEEDGGRISSHDDLSE